MLLSTSSANVAPALYVAFTAVDAVKPAYLPAHSANGLIISFATILADVYPVVVTEFTSCLVLIPTP